jgi:hypothetical protein
MFDGPSIGQGRTTSEFARLRGSHYARSAANSQFAPWDDPAAHPLAALATTRSMRPSQSRRRWVSLSPQCRGWKVWE